MSEVQHSVLIAAVTCLATTGLSAPYRNTDPGVKYVGSKVCAGCHSQIYAQYIKTAMGRSFTLPSPQLVSTAVTIHSDLLNRDFRVYREGESVYQVESESRDGQLVFENKHKIEYVIGSGENGMSFVVRRGDHLFQAPLSYYSRAAKWDLSPGYEETDQGFNRPIYDACITCHAGRPQPVAGRDGLYSTPPFTELAVGCENCHGPGELHVKERGSGFRGTPDDSIVNPSRLPARLAEDICMKCHQGGAARVLLPGKNYTDFRAGTRLAGTVAIFSLPLSPNGTDLLEHHVSMKLSACYWKSSGKLSCLTCHDPHRQPDATAAPSFYRSRCFTCHTGRDCTESATARAANADNCIACHMPKRDVEKISHSALTNHRIPRRPDAIASNVNLPEAEEPDLPGLLLLDKSDEHVALPFVTRLAAYGELAGRSPALLSEYLSLLDRAAKVAPDNPVVLAALGRRSLLDKRPDALTYLIRAVDRGSASVTTLIDLSEALDQAGRTTESASALEKALDLFPYSKDVRKRLILHYIQLARYPDARSAMVKYIAEFPEDDFMRSLLHRVGGDGLVVIPAISAEFFVKLQTFVFAHLKR